MDLSPAALEVARRNVERHAVGDRVHLLEGDLAAPLDGRYDAVLANLPYLPDGVELGREVLAQPPIALFAGPELVNRLLAELPRLLAPAGIALLEIDPAITGELKLEGLGGSRIHKDLGGHDRVLGYVDPPLELSVHGTELTVSALNDRGRVLIPALREVLTGAVARSVGQKAAELKGEKRSGLAVHARTGLPCPVCGDTIREVSFHDSNFQYCPGCQTGGKPLADRRLSKLIR